VFTYFLDEYKAGRTANPDIISNKEIKIKAFLDYALQLGADNVETGHYAQIARSSGESKLLKGLDENKDKTYFLCQLSYDVLDIVMFPLDDIDKSKIRDITEKYDIAK